MSLLEKEIWTTLGKNTKHYEEKLYEIPRSLNDKGRLRVVTGEKILVRVEDLPIESHVLVTKVCDHCGKVVGKQTYGNILKRRSALDGTDRCRKCMCIYTANITRRNNIKYENSLEHYAKTRNLEYLLDEFSNKNIKKPSEISFGASRIRQLWNCPDCGSEYDDIPYRRLNGSMCPFCQGYRVNHTNSLSAVCPEISAEWHPFKNGDLTPNLVTKSSNKNVWWLCSDCNHSYRSVIYSRTGYAKSGCPKCSASIGERKIIEYFKINNVKYHSEYTFPDCKDRRKLLFDFAVIDENNNVLFIIEYDGEQHFRPVKFGGMSDKKALDQFLNTKRRDEIKNKYCRDKQIILYRIPYTDKQKIDEILDSYFDFKKI